MNQVYRSFFKENPPTRATVQADLAVPGALVEIEMLAAKKDAGRKVIKPSKLASPALPFSWGVEAGNMVFVAGATSRNPETFEPVGGDIKTQTRQVLANIGAVLEEAGLTYSDVVECSVFLDDPRDFAAMNEVYRTVFTEAPPARATMRAKLMNPIHKIEIQCSAVRGGDRRPVYPEGANKNAPYSPAIAAGDRLFLAGRTGRGPDGYAPGDLEAQTRQALASLRRSLAADGLDFSDVISTRIYYPGIGDGGAQGVLHQAPYFVGRELQFDMFRLTGLQLNPSALGSVQTYIDHPCFPDFEAGDPRVVRTLSLFS